MSRLRINGPWKKRLYARVMVNPADPDGCWTWSGATAKGYGVTSVNGRNSQAHRALFELYEGPIPAGLVLDHVCGVRVCVNPNHLRAVTHKQNMEHRTVGHAGRSLDIRGASWDPSRRKWLAHIRHNGKMINCGRFDTAEEAAAAARAKRAELFTHDDWSGGQVIM